MALKQLALVYQLSVKKTDFSGRLNHNTAKMRFPQGPETASLGSSCWLDGSLRDSLLTPPSLFPPRHLRFL